RLTDRTFWADYWKSKLDRLITTIPPDFLFSKTLSKFLPQRSGLEFIELGGFPGFYSIFFKKYYGYHPTLFDYYIDREIIAKLSKINNVFEDINVIEEDFFNFKPENSFDVVMSVGLVEHFTDLQAVIDLHVKLLKQKGYLVIAVPNF